MAGAVKAADAFWESLRLSQLSPGQWESLCDGCGRCCLEKLLDPRTGKVYYTDLVCSLFDVRTCRCRDYDRRSRIVDDCLQLRPGPVARFRWLPRTCAYRLLAEGQELAWWHPLVSGRADSVHEAGVSLLGRPITPRHLSPAAPDSRIVRWGIWAKRAGTGGFPGP